MLIFMATAGVSVTVRCYIGALGSVGNAMSGTLEDHSPRLSRHIVFFSFLVLTHMQDTGLWLPSLRAPLLTDPRRSTVGPGTREDHDAVQATHAPGVSTSHQLLQGPEHLRSGGYRISTCH